MQLSLNKSAAMSSASSMLGSVSGDSESTSNQQLSRANAAMAEAESLAKAPPVKVLDFLPNVGDKLREQMQGMLVKDEIKRMEEMDAAMENIKTGAGSVGKGGK